MKRTLIVLALLAGTGLEARIPQQPGIQHKIPDGCFNPMWDEVNEVWICEGFGGEGGGGSCSPKTFCYLPACDAYQYFTYCMAKWASCDGTLQTCTCKGDMNLGTHTRRREGGDVL